MSTGLDDLVNRRKGRSGRQTPAPKHPRSEHPEPATETPEPPPAVSQPVPAATSKKRRSDATRGRRTPSVEAYLTPDLAEWLIDLDVAALTSRRERLPASGVIRLALHRLRADLTTEEIVDQVLQAQQNR